MKKILLLILLVSGLNSIAQRSNFVYLRYDLSQGDPLLVVDALESIIHKTSGIYVIFYSDGLKSKVCVNSEDWAELRKSILTQLSSPDYYPEEDVAKVNALLIEYLSETVDPGSLSLHGGNDGQWSFTFLLSNEMLSDASESDIIPRLITINDLDQRMKVSILSYDESKVTQLDIDDLKINKLFKYFEGN